MTKKTIVIGTRDSELALWQAKTVQRKLEQLGYSTQLHKVKSTGDLILDKPLYEMGITGIFTRTLDIALVNESIDIAVHSMKDVPTILPRGVVQCAVLERADTRDILVYNNNLDFLNGAATIATGSLRRKAQWLHKYPNHQLTDLRGNVNTRLKKLADNDWNGAIFAKAGLERINLLPQNYTTLDWMIPAPAQGAMVVVTLDKNDFCKEALAKLNHQEAEICTTIERQFLRTLEGGCTAPIGASAKINNDKIEFVGVLFALNGQQRIDVSKTVDITNSRNLGRQCALEVLEKGGRELMAQIKEQIS